jgi:hypothetical protein
MFAEPPFCGEVPPPQTIGTVTIVSWPATTLNDVLVPVQKAPLPVGGTTSAVRIAR